MGDVPSAADAPADQVGPLNHLFPSRPRQWRVVQSWLRKSFAVFSYILGRTVYAAPRAGADAEHGSEDSVEMTLVRESARICDFRQR